MKPKAGPPTVPLDAFHAKPTLANVFQKIDVDASGTVSHPELYQEIQEAVPGSDVTEEEVLELIRDYDTVCDTHPGCSQPWYDTGSLHDARRLPVPAAGRRPGCCVCVFVCVCVCLACL